MDNAEEKVCPASRISPGLSAGGTELVLIPAAHGGMLPASGGEEGARRKKVSLVKCPWAGSSAGNNWNGSMEGVMKGLAACLGSRLPGELGKGLLEKVSSLLQGWSGPCLTSRSSLLWVCSLSAVERGDGRGSSVWDVALPSAAYS